MEDYYHLDAVVKRFDGQLSLSISDLTRLKIPALTSFDQRAYGIIKFTSAEAGVNPEDFPYEDATSLKVKTWKRGDEFNISCSVESKTKNISISTLLNETEIDLTNRCPYSLKNKVLDALRNPAIVNDAMPRDIGNALIKKFSQGATDVAVIERTIKDKLNEARNELESYEVYNLFDLKYEHPGRNRFSATAHNSSFPYKNEDCKFVDTYRTKDGWGDYIRVVSRLDSVFVHTLIPVNRFDLISKLPEKVRMEVMDNADKFASEFPKFKDVRDFVDKLEATL